MLRSLVLAALVASGWVTGAEGQTNQPMDHSAHGMHMMGADPAAWRMPPMPPEMPMPPGLENVVPDTPPWLPGSDIDPSTVPEAVFRTVERLADGDTLDLTAGLVRRRINGRTFVMYGFNGQYPGPLIEAEEGSTVTVLFHNQTDWPTAVHWHGVRLDNRFDGVPFLTQDPVEPGESFEYQVHFRDAGIYWYHPHHREDVMQDLGLYGNMLIRSAEPEYLAPVNREEILMLDDLLVDAAGLFPYGAGHATQALMGRFGNQLLVNGEPDYRLEAKRGEVVRFYLTNVANTRIFNLVFGGAPMKVVATDASRLEREVAVSNVVIAPAERYVVDVLFEESGSFSISNNVQAIDHYKGEFFSESTALGRVDVAGEGVAENHQAEFEVLRENDAVIAEIDRYREAFSREPDFQLDLGIEIGSLPLALLQMIAVDTLFYPPVEWNDLMPEMNYHSTSENVRWFVRDPATGRENMDIDWQFRVGDVVKIRIFNDPASPHPMQHPIHLHGQRFLLVARDGVLQTNLAWKDTVLLPVGSTVDLVVEMSNPGSWMLHCHIAEHLEAGMRSVFQVE